jgi:lipopolysaccharide transport system permease protein
LIFFAGLIVHGLFAECANRSPSLIVSQAPLVKKVVFPIEILPLIPLLNALLQLSINLIALLIFSLVIRGTMPITIIALPLVILPFLIFNAGMMLLLSSLGVFLRDLGQITGLLVTITMFVTPIFFPIAAVPERFRPYLMLNPLTLIVEDARGVLLFGKWPDLASLLLYLVGSLIVLWVGYAGFQKARRGFADVL